MNGKRATIVPAALAIAVAIGVIAFGMYAGIPINQTNVTSSDIGAAASNQGSALSSVQASSSSSPQASGSSAPISSSSPSASGQGSLSILLTDPPNIPQGVTAIYISYRNLDVHVSKAGNQTGWTEVQSSGEVQLLGTVNVSQTISSVKIATGDYNQLRFNISSAEVTYDGQNYTAFVQSAELVVPIIHGIEVNASVPSVTIIDISPTVVNIGSSSTPEFIIKSVATAYPVPSGSVTTGMQQQGNKTSLIGVQWWTQLQQNYTANLVITAASLNATHLSVSVTNTGSNSTALTLVVVSPLVSALSSNVIVHGQLPTSFMGSAVFAILPNGTLVPVRIATPLATDVQSSVSADVFRTTGLNLSASESAVLSYEGLISLGFLSPAAEQGGVVSHQQYLVTVIGTQAVASFVVVAT